MLYTTMGSPCKITAVIDETFVRIQLENGFEKEYNRYQLGADYGPAEIDAEIGALNTPPTPEPAPAHVA